MDKFESKLTLSALLKRCPVLYVEHNIYGVYSYGRYYAITDNEVRHITFDVAMCLDMLNEDSIVEVLNRKTTKAEKCLKIRRPDSAIRDLSQFLYGRWNAIKFYSLENERIF